ncbi:hypothetical protein [Herbaspirillum sp. SJZ107]|uniref:hypothetical protein n=1 Tax=Herbaspirillum sp. SJZ107 TaxID=2572881 RepID=UPI001175C23B|nr:hypothetical protein [Herbaspirillum sp. SJZ107]TQK00159.1 helix-turn-helix protein [Herbaspirillum sp. SJZ107]
MKAPTVNANAPGEGGAVFDRAGGPAVHKIVVCGAQNITDVCNELTIAGVALQSADGKTQLDTLRRALQYRGARGLNTYEGTAAGYLRLATRVKELRKSWDIYTLSEDVVGPDGLLHKRVARYVLRGRRQDLHAPARSLLPEVRP